MASLFFRRINMSYYEEFKERSFVMSTYSYLRDLSKSYDPYILDAIDNDLEDHIAVLVDLMQSCFNQLLKVDGRVYLEKVYNSFGLETTVVDRVVGWEIDSKNGDGFIDLGYRVIERDDGSKRYIIDPNVDGLI